MALNIYIFPYVVQLTDRYHQSGGLVVVARDRDEAEFVIASHNEEQHREYREDCGIGPDEPIDRAGIVLTEEEWSNAFAWPIAGEILPTLFVFPNAGCC